VSSARNVIALLGLRASGKSTLGRLLARELALAFLDLDEELLHAARRAGVHAASAGELLAARGEREFRAFEADALRRLLEPGQRLVLATGGGVVERADNRAWLARAARCVLLNVPPAELARRRGADPLVRPLLAGRDAREESELLWRRREAWYRGLAEVEIEAGAEPPEALVARVRTALESGGNPLRARQETPDLHG
jgi:shikimate kinase